MNLPAGNRRALLWLALMLMTAPLHAVEIGGTLLLLELVINEEPSGEIAEVTRTSDGDWLVYADDLRQMRIDIDEAFGARNGIVRLSGVAGLSVRYDEPRQRLMLSVSAANRSETIIGARAARARPAADERGMLLNYDVSSGHSDGYTGLRAFLEQRFYSGTQVFQNSGIASDSANYRRLETVWLQTDIDTLRRRSIGDVSTRVQGNQRAVRMFGLQYARDFSAAPGLLTRPIPVLSGLADMPSTVDLYIDNIRQLSTEVPEGPFVIEQPPALIGAGRANVVVTDLLGRQRVETLDLYLSNELLSPGLSDYALSAGKLRTGFGTPTDRYLRGPAFAGNWRYGLSETLTIELQGEAHRAVSNVGAGFVRTIGRLGQFNANVSVNDKRNGGHAGTIGYRFQNRVFSASSSLSVASDDYRDLATQTGVLPVRRQLRLLASVMLNARSALNASYIDQRLNTALSTGQALALDSDRTRVFNVGFRRMLGESATLSVNALNDIDSTGVGVFIALSWRAGQRMHMQSNVERDRGEYRTGVSASSRRIGRTGLAWQARQTAGANDASTFSADYSGNRFETTTTVRNGDSGLAAQASLRGSLLYSDGGLIAGRRLNGAFAVISTAGVANVPVYHEGRLAGYTDRGGRLLVDEINAYQHNRIAIEPLAISLDYRLRDTERSATPALNAGSLVRFDLQAERETLIRLVAAGDFSIPAGARVESAAGRTLPMPVGYDGLLLVDNALMGRSIRVSWRDSACLATLPAAAENSLDLVEAVPCQ